MSNFKVKNRQKKALRNGKKNGGFNNQVTKEQMMKRIISFLENHEADILKAARDFYEGGGRGCVNVSLTNYPNHPYKTGRFYYVTEKQNKEIQSRIPFPTENDIRISEDISTYEPTIQAVVCVWYGTMYYVTKLTDTYAAFGAAWKDEFLTVH